MQDANHAVLADRLPRPLTIGRPVNDAEIGATVIKRVAADMVSDPIVNPAPARQPNNLTVQHHVHRGVYRPRSAASVAATTNAPLMLQRPMQIFVIDKGAPDDDLVLAATAHQRNVG
ncbi:MAG: hypothetical protein IPN24_18445 [Betaproteobacteria bacterium]|nr:hypothetical protein [Betaproteobacteria bacterium]